MCLLFWWEHFPNTGREEEMLERLASNVLRRILVNKGDEVLHSLYFSPFVVSLIISRKLREVCETYSPRNVYRNLLETVM
jgi:trehalose utilization protein